MVIEEKKFKNIESERFGPKSVNDLTFGTHKASCTHLVDCIYQLLCHRLQYFPKNPLFNFFPYKSIGDQIWPCRKIAQGQNKVIIWTNLVVLEYPMVHTNSQGHRLFGSREEEFFMFLPYWAWRPSWYCDLDHLNKLSFPHPIEAPHEIWLQWT